jgi:hypothetical protein
MSTTGSASRLAQKCRQLRLRQVVSEPVAALHGSGLVRADMHGRAGRGLLPARIVEHVFDSIAELVAAQGK